MRHCVVTYHCGIGLGLPLAPRDPGFTCDGKGCAVTYSLGTRLMAPAWFLDGKAPPKWLKITDGDKATHFCPACKLTAKPARTRRAHG